MRWDDIIIGEGNSGNSATTKFSCDKIDILENSTSYWITNRILNISLTIFKYTDEGIRLKKVLDKSEPDEFVYNLILSFILKNIAIYKFNNSIDKIRKDSFVAGIKHKEQQLRAIFGIES